MNDLSDEMPFFLIRKRRYILDNIEKIDGEFYKLIKIADGKINIFTDKYIYEFEKIDDQFVNNLALFIQRKDYDNEEYKSYIKSLSPQMNYSGYPYIYSEEDLEIDQGDFPTHEELLKRLKKKDEMIKECMDPNKRRKYPIIKSIETILNKK